MIGRRSLSKPGWAGTASVCAVAILGPSASAHAATQFSSSWKTNDYTGCCVANRSGGHVLAIQQFERSYGANKDALDDYWGPHSDAGLKALQRYYRITADGCAGPITWSYMRGSLISRCRPGYVCFEPTALIALGYTYQYFSKSSYNCSWTSYTNVNPVAGPVRQRTLLSSVRSAMCEAT